MVPSLLIAMVNVSQFKVSPEGKSKLWEESKGRNNSVGETTLAFSFYMRGEAEGT